ncbi:helix-turn-helix transcriptional regulator [Sporolactobacillus laevolacticus]|uniref:helix-turn-helix transcriptional regulator n=1 Tax=Sporolactobacillus laevolacticus TaxID=33018 RepID=UPI0025B30D94|nr:PAS domain-containing protein [Sporolactobacillus laevolacticus]MDN3954927.1 PAS domain-containing protein [Sporolactobacillus laevolacticus]
MHRYKKLVSFLGDVMGEDAEIILHDVRDLENSVIAVSETNLSGRKIGSPVTNLILKMLIEGKKSNKSFITNFEGEAQDGTVLRSSTYFIRDENDEIIGMLCININFKKMEEAIRYLSDFVGVDLRSDGKEESNIDHLSPSIEDIAISSIKEIVSSMNVPSERMSQQEKLEVVNKLNDNGIFLLKGIVGIVAKELKTSEATIYRYLSKMKKNELNISFDAT